MSLGERNRRIGGIAAASVALLAAVFPAAAQADDCPNAQFRTGASRALSDCRAYEQVSPADKNGGDVTGDGNTVIAAADGSAVAYSSRTLFANTVGSGALGQSQYIGRRASGEWLTRAITPRSREEASQVFLGSTVIPLFSDDLRRAVVWAYDLPEVSDDTPLGLNVYWQDTDTNALGTLAVSQADPIGLSDFSEPIPWGSSRDARHLSLVSSSRLLPEAPAGVPSVYEWHDGTLRLAGVLPGGEIPEAGSNVVPLRYAYRRTMSADGSRLTFVSPPAAEPQLYLRIDASRTVWVSQPESSAPAPPPAEVMLQAMTDDGRNVLFTTSSRLLDADTNDGSDLYRYTDSANPASDPNLTLLSNTGSVPGMSDGSTSVIGVSDDAQRIYFMDTANNLFLWDHGSVRPVSADVPRSYDGKLGTRLGLTDSVPGASRVSPDGRYLAFLTNGTHANDEVHGLTGEVTNGHVELYLYDADADRLVCLSCPKDRPATVDVTIVPQATLASSEMHLQGRRPRYLSADGRRVFFSSAEALVAGDVNGLTDAYQYDTVTGELALISSGRGADGGWFVDASESGDDVFFVTRERLVEGDRDNQVDLYDARVGGGFAGAAPAQSPCAGDACQGALRTALADLAAGSVAFEDRAGKGRAGVVRVSVTRFRSVVGSRAALVVRVPKRGTIRWAGKGIRRGSRTVGRAGAYRVRVSLSARARERLERTRSYRVRLKLTFTRPGGTTSRAVSSLTFNSRKGR